MMRSGWQSALSMAIANGKNLDGRGPNMQRAVLDKDRVVAKGTAPITARPTDD